MRTEFRLSRLCARVSTSVRSDHFHLVIFLEIISSPFHLLSMPTRRTGCVPFSFGCCAVSIHGIVSGSGAIIYCWCCWTARFIGWLAGWLDAHNARFDMHPVAHNHTLLSSLYSSDDIYGFDAFKNSQKIINLVAFSCGYADVYAFDWPTFRRRLPSYIHDCSYWKWIVLGCDAKDPTITILSELVQFLLDCTRSKRHKSSQKTNASNERNTSRREVERAERSTGGPKIILIVLLRAREMFPLCSQSI